LEGREIGGGGGGGGEEQGMKLPSYWALVGFSQLGPGIKPPKIIQK